MGIFVLGKTTFTLITAIPKDLQFVNQRYGQNLSRFLSAKHIYLLCK